MNGAQEATLAFLFVLTVPFGIYLAHLRSLIRQQERYMIEQVRLHNHRILTAHDRASDAWELACTLRREIDATETTERIEIAREP